MTSNDPAEPLPEWLYRLSDSRSFQFSLSVSAACLLLATIARAGLGLFEPNIILFATYYPAILAATLFAGYRWGAFVMVSGWFLAWFLFAAPRFEFKPLGLPQFLSMGLYAMSASLLIILGEAHRRLLGRLQLKRKRLMAEKAHSELLLGELNHRAKNTIAVISSIVSQSLKADRSSAEIILGRMRAYASNDSMLEPTVQTSALRELIDREVAAHGHQVTSMGPEVHLPGDVGKAISMVVHELATNAVKHGALSQTGGTVDITWTIDGSQATLLWMEQGGPTVTQPTRLGFGTFLIERLLNEHGGGSTLAFDAKGVSCTLSFPCHGETLATTDAKSVSS